MEKKGICQSCQAEPGSHTCAKCGRLIGENCWRGKLCKDCQTGVS